jgi:hypothetical protein
MQPPDGTPPVVFTPGNEPYLGRQSVFHFDQVILSCLEANGRIAAATRAGGLSPLQAAACQIIPQGINLALSIRELVRQGYLFGAVVLMRPLIERAAIISHVSEHPEALALWEKGWEYRHRPSLREMLKSMNGGADSKPTEAVAETFNHILHGDPVGAAFNLVKLGQSALGYAVGKSLHDPALCDFVCFQSYCYLIVLHARAAFCFPEPAASASPPSN